MARNLGKASRIDAEIGLLNRNDDDDDESVSDLMNRALKSNSLKQAKDQQTKASTDILKGDEPEAVTAVKKRRAVASLTTQALLNKDGLDALRSRLADFEPKSISKPGQEMNDLARMLHIMKSWASNLDVRESSSWPDFVEKLDKVKKADIRKYLVSLRAEAETVSSWSPLLKAVEVDMAPQSPGDVQSASPKRATLVDKHSVDNHVASLPTVTTGARLSLSDEQKRIIEEKKREALRKLEERKRANCESTQTNLDSRQDVSFSQLPTQIVEPFSQLQTQLVEGSVAIEELPLETVTEQQTQTQNLESWVDRNVVASGAKYDTREQTEMPRESSDDRVTIEQPRLETEMQSDGGELVTMHSESRNDQAAKPHLERSLTAEDFERDRSLVKREKIDHSDA